MIYTHYKSGHLWCNLWGQLWYLHRLSWVFNRGPIPEGMIVHHVDEDQLNNHPDNLTLKEHSEHSRYHQTKNNSFKGKTHTQEFKTARSKNYARSGNPRYKHNVSDDLIQSLRNAGLNWSAIQRETGLDRKSCKLRLDKAAEGQDHRLD